MNIDYQNKIDNFQEILFQAGEGQVIRNANLQS